MLATPLPIFTATFALAILATSCKFSVKTEVETQRTPQPEMEITAPVAESLPAVEFSQKEKLTAQVFENKLLAAILASQASQEFKTFAKDNLKTGRKNLSLSTEEYVATAERCSRVLSHAEGPDIAIVGETIRRIVEDFSDIVIQGVGALCLHRINQARVSKHGSIASARQSVTVGLSQSIAKIAPDETAYDDLMVELAHTLPEDDLVLPADLTARIEGILGGCVEGSFRVSSRGEPLICEPWTECPPGQLETEPPTTVSDRVCGQHCDPATEYQLEPSMPGQEPVCAPLTICDPLTQFENAPPGPSNDRECLTITECRPSQFESIPATPLNDRQCTEYTPCQADQFESRPPTATSDRECSPPSGACPLGTGFVRQHSATHDRICIAYYNSFCEGNVRAGEFFVPGKGCRRYFTDWADGSPSPGMNSAVVFRNDRHWSAVSAPMSSGFFLCASGPIPDLSSESRNFTFQQATSQARNCPNGSVFAKPETEAENRAIMDSDEWTGVLSINFQRNSNGDFQSN